MSDNLRFQFDNFSSKGANHIDVIYTDAGVDLHLVCDGKTICKVTCDRDQWGNWINFNDASGVAQEDGTRSFVDSAIRALQKLKEFELDTRPATELKSDGATCPTWKAMEEKP